MITETFHIKYRWVLTLSFVALFSPVIYLALKINSYEHLMLAILNIAICVIGIWFFSVISISSEGLVLYKVNRLKWDEIEGAKKVKILGLPYILIKRKKGFKWWLPLYFTGKTDINDSLRQNVPNGNPILETVNE